MKDLIISPEVEKKIEVAMREFYELCEANNIPVVIGALFKRVKKNNETEISKGVSVFIDQSTGAYDSSLAAAFEMLKMDSVPERLIRTMRQANALNSRFNTQASNDDDPYLIH